MSDVSFEEIDRLNESAGAEKTIDDLIERLRTEKDYHRLFDALVMRKRLEMKLPLVRPTDFRTVPEEQQGEFEEHYIAAAREVGNLLIADSKIPEAWVYLRTIRETEPVSAALDKIDVQGDLGDRADELINVALFEGAHRVKGIEIMLRTHGTCNSVTTFDQQVFQMSEDERQRSAALLVRELYGDLCGAIRYHIERVDEKMPSTELSLAELMQDRDWLCAEGNYHIDVSHLNAIVRFARFLKEGDEELQLATELALYGSKLDKQFQYPTDAPFDEYYEAHQHYFHVLADQQRDEGLNYFRGRLEACEDPDDRKMIAYVLVDLLTRIDRFDEAVELGEKFLKDVEDQQAFSFTQFCQKAGRPDVLRRVAKERGDVLAYAAALIDESRQGVTP